MFQAIQTKFIPCTNFRPSRVKAWAEAGSVTVSWDHALNVEENHRAAADALLAKLDWSHLGTLVGGALPSGGYAFTFKRPAPRDAFAKAETERINANAETISIRFSDFDSNATKYLNINSFQFAEIKSILGAI